MPVAQRELWDAQAGLEDHCGTFMRRVESNRWFDMFENLERATRTRARGRILEIGGGSQFLSRHLVRTRTDCSVVCTDISPDRLDRFTRHYGGVDERLTIMSDVDAAHLPFETGEFDFVVGDAVLHHIDELRAAMIEINRVLKPDGKALFIREPVVGPDQALKRAVKRWIRPNYDELVLKELKLQRYEYGNTLLQWMHEIHLGGFELKIVPGWNTYSRAAVLRARFPMVFTCLVGFHLAKVCNVTSRDFGKEAAHDR